VAPLKLVAELDEQLACEPPELADETVPVPPLDEITVKVIAICPGWLNVKTSLKPLPPTPTPIVLLGPEAAECEEPLGLEVVVALELTPHPPELPVKLVLRFTLCVPDELLQLYAIVVLGVFIIRNVTATKMALIRNIWFMFVTPFHYGLVMGSCPVVMCLLK
jgi:hypothetical protein